MKLTQKALIAATTLFVLGTGAQYTGKKICDCYKAYSVLDRSEEREIKTYKMNFLDGVCR